MSGATAPPPSAAALLRLPVRRPAPARHQLGSRRGAAPPHPASPCRGPWSSAQARVRSGMVGLGAERETETPETFRKVYLINLIDLNSAKVLRNAHIPWATKAAQQLNALAPCQLASLPLPSALP